MFNELTETDNKIIDYLMGADYKAKTINGYTIAREIKGSYTNVLLRLRILKDIGIVRKTNQGIYIVTDNARDSYNDFKTDKEETKKKLLDRAARIYKERQPELDINIHSENHARIIRRKIRLHISAMEVKEYIELSLREGTGGSKNEDKQKGSKKKR